ncbi:peptidase C69 [Bacteroidales bacterium]|nr:peptidase C69 [Bacteroidales bacterium]
MKKVLLSFTFLLIFFTSSFACTNLLVGKHASTDGSTMVTYSADSYALFGELYHWPAATYPKGTMLEVYEWDTGKFLGSIPQAQQTYNVVGNMNEHQLCIGETTFTGRGELSDSTGIMDYGSLIYITLQRAKNARDAIQTIASLVESHGYYSSGESFSIVDKNEVWVMELIGKGPGRKGAVWVAQRIPDDCISAHANQARIQQFPLKDKDNCIYSKDVISFAREKGYFKGKDADFSFAKAYAPLDFGALRFCEARVWSFFNRYNKDAAQWLDYVKGNNLNLEPMPLYIRPDRKLSAKDLMDMMRDHYEGTELDMTLDVGAGPFASPMRFAPLKWEVDSVTYCNERPIGTQQTGFTFVGQMRSHLPDIIGGVLWFGMDDATFTVYTPMYACMTSIPECYRVGNGNLYEFSWTSSFWIHNWVANMAYPRYSQMIQDIKPVQDILEESFQVIQVSVENQALKLMEDDEEKAVAMLTNYSIDQAQRAFDTWKKLGEKLMVKYVDGIVRKEQNGVFERNAHGNPSNPIREGYPEQHYRKIVEGSGEKFKVTN